jgi:hypothetical protein
MTRCVPYRTEKAVRVCLNGFRLPPNGTMALVPQSGFLHVTDPCILTTCPSIAARLPARFSLMHMAEMVDQCRCMLAALSRGHGRRHGTFHLSTIDSTEMEQREHVDDEYRRATTLLVFLHRMGMLGALLTSVGQRPAAHRSDTHTPIVHADVLERQGRIARDRKLRFVEDHLTSHIRTGPIVGTVAGMQEHAIHTIVKHAMLEAAAFLQVAVKPGFDGDLPSLLGSESEMVTVHAHDLRAMAAAHAALLRVSVSMLHARQGLHHRTVSLQRLATSMDLWDEAYLGHVMLWAHLVMDITDTILFCTLATGSPQMCGSQRRRFATFVLESISAIIWAFSS